MIWHLTPLHEGWGWGSRALEITAQTLSLVVLGPFILIHRTMDWIAEKWWNS
jgi:hypothetical protein